MSYACRRHSIIDAPLDQVWDVISNPRTHPDWWPEVQRVQMAGPATEGSEYVRVAKRFGFLDIVDAVWITERLDHLKEARFRCSVTGTYTRFSLTPAQNETFVEVEAGVDPKGVQGHIMNTGSRLWFRRWLGDLLDSLPKVVETATPASPHQGSGD